MPPVSPQKKAALDKELDKLDIKLQDIEEKRSRGSGSGGQKRNKTSNRIQLTHLPSGLSVQSQETRSLETNRFLALRKLVELFKESKGLSSHAEQVAEKIRKQKKKRQKRSLKKSSSPEGPPEN